MDYQSLSIDELVRECAEDSSPAVWQEFIRRFHRLIASVVMRASREWGVTAPDVIEDLIQETYLKLCANNCALLRNFQSRHENAFLGFLKTVTANVVFDYFRSEYAGKRNKGNTVELNEAIHQLHDSVAFMDGTEKEIFLKEVDELLRRRGTGPDQEKERAIFWLYYRHGLTAKEIASIPGIGMGVKGVESAIYRLTLYVKEELVTTETSTK